MDGSGDTPYALDYSESMAFFNSAYNQTSAQSITATEFDSTQELLWAGSNEVRIDDVLEKLSFKVQLGTRGIILRL